METFTWRVRFLGKYLEITSHKEQPDTFILLGVTAKMLDRTFIGYYGLAIFIKL